MNKTLFFTITILVLAIIFEFSHTPKPDTKVIVAKQETPSEKEKYSIISNESCFGSERVCVILAENQTEYIKFEVLERFQALMPPGSIIDYSDQPCPEVTIKDGRSFSAECKKTSFKPKEIHHLEP